MMSGGYKKAIDEEIYYLRDEQVCKATAHESLITDLMDPTCAKTEHEWAAAREITRLKAEIKRKDEALRCAQEFIENGVEFGYIKLPEPPDSAFNTLPRIKKALQGPEV